MAPIGKFPSFLHETQNLELHLTYTRTLLPSAPTNTCRGISAITTTQTRSHPIVPYVSLLPSIACDSFKNNARNALSISAGASESS